MSMRMLIVRIPEWIITNLLKQNGLRPSAQPAAVRAILATLWPRDRAFTTAPLPARLPNLFCRASSRRMDLTSHQKC
jgi:hypothetical protein